jgi:hypothetical protein
MNPKSDVMRKAILCSVLALSINTYAQFKKPVLNSEYSSLARQELLKGIKSRERKSHYASLLQIQEKSLQQKVTKASSFTPVYDDVYIWKRDIPGKIWVYDNRTINLVYDVNSNLLSSVTQKWNGSAWVNDQQVTYTYNTGNLTGEVWQVWNGSVWVNDYNYFNTYNANGFITIELGQLWSSGSWVNDFQSLNSYDASNNLINFTQQLWDGSVWANSYKEISTYNADNNITTKVSQLWDGIVWRNSLRYNFTYDSGKKLIGILEDSFNASDIWENYSLSTLTYDGGNNLINTLMQIWTGSAWENFSNLIYAYDGLNNLKSKTEQVWEGALWVQSALKTNTFDINNFVLSETNKNYTNSVYTSGDSTYYNIHTVITALKGETKENLSLFPNPGPGKFTIKSNSNIDKIEVFNLSGKLVYSDGIRKQQNSFETDISNCGKGVYLLKIHTGKLIFNKKIIIQ